MQYAKVHNSIWDNVRFLGLPSPEAKLAFFRVVSAGKDSDPEGQWPSRDYLEAALRGDAWAIPHLDAMFETGVIGADEGGRIFVSRSAEKWAYWQKWEGKRPAAQLAVEAPELLEKRRQTDARRQRIRDWVQKGMGRIEDCPEDIRDEVRSRLISAETSREAHDHTDGRTDGRKYYPETETPGGDSADAASPPSSDSSDDGLPF